MKLKQLITEGVLTEDQVKLLEENFEKVLEEKTLAFEKEANEHLAEQFKSANDKINEQKVLVEERDAKIVELESQLADNQKIISEQVMELEKSTLERLDLCLENIVDESLSEEVTAKLAKLELFESLFGNIKELLGNSIVKLDESTATIIEESKVESQKEVEAKEAILAEKEEEIKVLKENLEEQSQVAIAKTKETETLKKGLVLLRESDGLTEEESAKMVEFFEGKSLEETQSGVSEFKSIMTESTVTKLRTSFKKEASREASSKQEKVSPTASTDVQLDESRSVEEVQRQVEKRTNKGRRQTQFTQAESLLD